MATAISLPIRLNLFTSGWFGLLLMIVVVLLIERIGWIDILPHDSVRQSLEQIVELSNGSLTDIPASQATANNSESAANENNLPTIPEVQYYDALLVIGSLLSLVLFKINFSYRHSPTALLSIALVLACALAQWWLLKELSIWVPWLEVSLLILISWLLSFLEKQHQQPLRVSQNTFQQWGYQAIKYLQEQNELSSTWQLIQQLETNDDLLMRAYHFAELCERKRDYPRALTVYQWLEKQRKGYQDAQDKITKLTQISQSRPSLAGTVAMDSTVVMPSDGLQPPTLGRYKIDSVLGRGAMGVVYRGVDPKINREVAVKTLALSQEFDPTEMTIARERFFREAETAGQLKHPNIVTIYDVGEEHDLAFIAMDLLTGVPLDEHVKSESLLPPELVYQLMVQIAAGLDYAHQKGVVHRDIKPGNIIYDDEKRSVIITDFGIAHLTDHSKTRTGAILGSPFYMSPEQIQGKRVDGRSDIFSLGVSFYQLLTGRLPFAGESLATVALNITTQKHQPIRKLRPELPASASRIINKALQKDVDKRYQSVYELREALISALKRDYKSSPINQ
ncbi:MAG: serine/threonine-protein kinase [Kangiellaceae bacterium]|jgi:serine/threonine-protein kinase|nr:serine/threonine-protein kinase [Kangiellaceae bacterium]